MKRFNHFFCENRSTILVEKDMQDLIWSSRAIAIRACV
jgi:hypothetical protein